MIRSTRKFPSLPYFWSLIDWSLPSLNPYKGKLLRAQTIDDLAQIAKKRTPKVVFDYVQGGAVDEVAYSRSLGSVTGRVPSPFTHAPSI
jgi:L-lactate dehydrogenase (cytochrome)